MHISENNIRNLVKAIESALNHNKYHDERIWNYLIADILCSNISKYSVMILGKTDDIIADNSISVHYEPQPFSPRIKEGDSEIDFAFGDIDSIGQMGIKYKLPQDGRKTWVCFVEGKLLSDCSIKTTYDPFRNQIIRNIENLLCFQNNSKYPDYIHFTLLTPKVFHDNKYMHSRLYSYKMEEYAERNNILRDLEICKYNIRERAKDWTYPNIKERIKCLRLSWVTYEEIIKEDQGCEIDIIEQIILNKMHEKARDLFKSLKNKLENKIIKGDIKSV